MEAYQPTASTKSVGQVSADMLGGVALGTTFIPGYGDVAGIVADAAMYANYPEERTLTNYGLSALGILPFVPPVSALRTAGHVAERALDMSQAARMQRAQDLGFDTSRISYRGLSREYDPSKAGNYQMFTSSPEDASEYGSNVVSSYLRKGNNLVVDGGRNNFNSIPVYQLPDDVKANLHSSVGSVARTDDIAYAAQAAGYDSVSINNVFDKASNEIPLRPSASSKKPLSQKMMDFLDEVNASGMLDGVPDVALPPEIPRNYDPTTIDIIFDPKNIRSINAAFDPAKRESSNLTAGVGGAIVGGSALRALIPQEQERRPD